MFQQSCDSVGTDVGTVGGDMGKLTATQVRNLKEPGRYADGDGLYLFIKPSGTKSWMLRMQVADKRRDFGLGSTTDVSLADAREAAGVIRKQYRAGVDPVVEKRKARVAIPTFREAAELYHAEHRPSWKNRKHAAQILTSLKTHAFPALGGLRVDQIEGPAIREVLAPIWLKTPETARRVRQRIAAVLDWSHAKGWRPSEAPLRSIARGLPRQPKGRKHFAAMPYSEVPAFLERLRTAEPTVGRMALELLVLTATRSGEVRGATWEEVDLSKSLWTIPAGRMKAGKEHVIPLTLDAVAIFERAKKLKQRQTGIIFPGRKGPVSDMTLTKVVRDMGLSVTVHGFRSSFRDWVAEKTEFPGEVAEAALAHAIPNRVEAAYRRTDFLQKRQQLMATWAVYCRGNADASDGAEVDQDQEAA